MTEVERTICELKFCIILLLMCIIVLMLLSSECHHC